MYMPEEYVLTGASMNSRSSANSTISSNRRAISRFVRPSMIPLMNTFFFKAEDGIRHKLVTGVQTCALPIYRGQPEPVLLLQGLVHQDAHRDVPRSVGALAAEQRANDRERGKFRNACHGQSLLEIVLELWPAGRAPDAKLRVAEQRAWQLDDDSEHVGPGE